MNQEHNKNESKLRRFGWRSLQMACVLFFAAEVLVHKHPHFAVENVYGFYALLGMIGTLILVVLARLLKPLLSKEEDYYDL